VLGGKLAPLRGIGPEDLNIPNLTARLDAPGIREVLLALPADVEGEATAGFLAGELEKRKSIRVSRLAFGVSVGSALSSSDPRSIHKSIAGRIFY
jgi:recombination protein RecR